MGIKEDETMPYQSYIFKPEKMKRHKNWGRLHWVAAFPFLKK